MNYKLFLFALVILPYCIFANDTDLLNEYKLLYTDISNVNTIGYKSYFNILGNKAEEKINFSQGSLMFTGIFEDLAIIGEGFFKIRLENNVAGYTRAGKFHIDIDGNFVTPQGFYLYDNVNLQGNFLPESIKIAFDGQVFVTIYEGGGELREIKAGQIAIYKIPGDLLIRYNDTIFILKPGAEYTPEKVELNHEFFPERMIHKCLEYSNVYYLQAVLRMYYILSIIGDGYIKNIEFKKEMLKLVIENLANNYSRDEILLSIDNNIFELYKLLEESGLFDTIEEEVENDNESLEEKLIRRFVPRRNTYWVVQRFNAQRFLNNQFYFLNSILPYLRFDY